MISRKIILSILAVTMITGTVFSSGTEISTVKLPDEVRAKQIQDMKWGMFICWSFSTFYGHEWTPTLDKDASYFTATGCDTDQWVRTAKEAGMGYILFLAKHHDGFCLWDTKTTEKKVTNSPLGIDVLAKLKESCDKYGLKLALYFSEGDWNWPGAADGKGHWVASGKNPEMKKEQLRELLTQYGPIEFWWMDHAAGTGGLSHKETVEWMHKFQPNTFVGFNHGEKAGRIALREVGRPGPLGDPKAASPHNRGGEEGHNFLLAEFTYPILPKHKGGAMWFYSLPKHDNLCHPAEKVFDDYQGAQKYGNIFSINIGPNYEGKLRDIDVKTLRQVGEMIRAAEKDKKTEKSEASVDQVKDIKAYCLDFNWGGRRRFAKPGNWNSSDPKAHVEWYKSIGANVVQTFCVSCNGYAWYKNGFVPEQPGLKHDFLPEVVKFGHKEGMKVFGYFCIAANTRWGKENPELSYGTPADYHIPYTDEYLDFLSKSIKDAVAKTGIDGFMIDWLWQPRRKSTMGKWIDSEKKLYKQLMGEEFPGEDVLTKVQDLEYSRKAIDRCWKTIRKAAKDANPNCIIWVTTNQMNHPHVVNSDMYKEADWLMNEKGDIKSINQVKNMAGEHTRMITCLARWNRKDATKVVPEAIEAGIGLYGFAKPRKMSGLIPLEGILSKPVSELKGDDRNIAVLARAYHGASIDSIKNDEGEFVEPK